MSTIQDKSPLLTVSCRRLPGAKEAPALPADSFQAEPPGQPASTGRWVGALAMGGVSLLGVAGGAMAQTAQVQLAPPQLLDLGIYAPKATVSSQAERSPLQRHVDFFDQNHDGLTHVSETYTGLRSLGMGRMASAGASVAIHAGLAHKTGAPWYSLTIHNDNIKSAKHDSDSDVYDPQGNLDMAKFSQMFEVNDRNHDGALDKTEIDAMLARNKETKAGGLAAGAEFGLLLKLAGQPDDTGQTVLTRERMQSLYNGTLFYSLAAEHAAAQH